MIRKTLKLAALVLFMTACSVAPVFAADSNAAGWQTFSGSVRLQAVTHDYTTAREARVTYDSYTSRSLSRQFEFDVEFLGSLTMKETAQLEVEDAGFYIIHGSLVEAGLVIVIQDSRVALFLMAGDLDSFGSEDASTWIRSVVEYGVDGAIVPRGYISVPEDSSI